MHALSSSAYLLVSELCQQPYHTEAMVIFLSANHSNYHHFFIKCCAQLTPSDLDQFITNNIQIA